MHVRSGRKSAVEFFLRQHDHFTAHGVVLGTAQLSASHFKRMGFVDCHRPDARGFELLCNARRECLLIADDRRCIFAGRFDVSPAASILLRPGRR